MKYHAQGLSSKLLLAPKSAPKYPITIKDAMHSEVILANPKATRSMLALMDLAAVNGGAACHWGGPSAMVELTTALHALMFRDSNWFEKYNFVNDIGHAENGIYALRANLGYGDLNLDTLLGFRSLGSKLTGHGESHLYPEGVFLSNGPLGSAFPQAQGVAIADKVLMNDRVTICCLSDGASMEGEAKEAMAAIPGLAAKGKMNPFVLIVSDNNTKLGGRIDKDSFSMQMTFDSLKDLGWNVVNLAEAHDLTSAYNTLKKVLDSVDALKPIAIRCKTIKGYGIKSTAESSSGGHGFPLKAYDAGIEAMLTEIWGTETVPTEFINTAKKLQIKPISTVAKSTVLKDKIQIGVATALLKAKSEGYPVFSITSDLQGSTGMKAFHSKAEDSYIDVGVAESNMVSTAAGMSKLGFIPVVDTFAAFGVTKGNLPLVMAALSECPVICMFSHTGFQDAADGASHQSLTYMAAVSSIPNTISVNLSSAKEAEEYIYLAVKDIAEKRKNNIHPSSYVFFLGRENFAIENKTGLDYKLLAPQILEEGTDGVIVACGSLTEEGMKAVEKLKNLGKKPTLINHPFVNIIETKIFKDLLAKNGNKLITVEDHQVIGGMGSLLTHALKLDGCEFKLKSLAIHGEFGQSSYSALELYKKHKVDSESIVKAFNEI